MRKLLIKSKLLILASISVSGLTLFSVLSYYTIEKLKINGELYNKIVEGKDIIADILPPPEYIIESYLMTLEMVNAKSDVELDSCISYFKKLERDYYTRHAYWLEMLEQGEIKEDLTQRSFEPAHNFYVVVDSKLIPLLKSKDTQNALALIDNEIKPLYNEHRKCIDKVVTLSNAQNSEVEREAKSVIHLSYVMLIILFFGILISNILLSGYIIASITKPLKQIVGRLKLLSTGNTRDIEKMEVVNHDELGELTESLNTVINSLQGTELFALDIGRGNLESEYRLLSDKDYLGNALIEMQVSLKKNKEEVDRYNSEQDKQRWISEGIAQFNELLRQYNHDINKLGYNLISNLLEHLDANQGALFVLNDENSDDLHFELISAVAYGRQKLIEKRVYIGEGLVGRCAFEKKYIYLTKIPQNYITITSGLGEANPRSLLIFPCIINNEVFAIIELASFNQLQQHEIEFAEKLSESIASTISSVRMNEKTARLLKASQMQGEELASQEEEMRQNLEEMQATQEDFKRQMAETAELSENLKKETILLNSLMNNIYDLIYFKDKNSHFLRVSKSMLEVHQLASFDQITGKTDFDFSIREEAQKYYDDEQKIIKTGNPILNQLQKETHINGQIHYTSTSKYPLNDTDGKIIGTFGFTKDITDYKKLEEQAALKENEINSMLKAIKNSAITIECTADGTITDVNSHYCWLTGLDSGAVIGKSMKESLLLTESEFDIIWSSIINGDTVQKNAEININKQMVKLVQIYSPVTDADGNVLKVLYFGFNLNGIDLN